MLEAVSVAAEGPGLLAFGSSAGVGTRCARCHERTLERAQVHNWRDIDLRGNFFTADCQECIG